MANSDIPAVQQHPLSEVRANPSRFAPPWAKDVTGWERVTDYEVASEDGAKVPVKVYHPDSAVHGIGPYGVHLNFHGGGFVLGDLTTESSLCLSLRDGAGVVVVDVNYRHCPESAWGKGIEDAWAALQWVRNSAKDLNINPESVSIGGISAGGHISIIIQHMARDAGIPLRLCMATVPPSENDFLFMSYSESPFQSFHDFHDGPILGWGRIEWFGQLCFPRDKLEERKALVPEWWIGPLHAKNWSGLCDTFIRTGECDPLRDEGEAYGMKLVAGGTKVTFKRYLGCPHLFMFYETMAQKKEYDEDSIQALRKAHRSGKK
ncbi:Alpha/Beta hydrolase protein [Pseudomassariella vexata]|uniref:Alpha/Beta hydrolase protein n=1 Tax=Pseudomassariella vexata TaxID=1141098 RepID=A0A1Y2DDU9_9PEZI|nr:Alpha/Beta hydrolase protein [Pseudomassariella vexata]ORY57463.1 Alpha/Beta hydrolase protein [Pseudomassariella vexata]